MCLLIMDHHSRPQKKCKIGPEPVLPLLCFPALFSVMCYNVLCDKYATRQLYGYCPSWALNWEYRKKSIMQEILTCNADIISLQVRRCGRAGCRVFSEKKLFSLPACCMCTQCSCKKKQCIWILDWKLVTTL